MKTTFAVNRSCDFPSLLPVTDELRSIENFKKAIFEKINNEYVYFLGKFQRAHTV